MNPNEYRIRELQIIISALKGSHPDEVKKYEKELEQLLEIENRSLSWDKY